MSNTPNQKRRRAERTQEFLTQLAEQFPLCFFQQRDAVRPLAIGIEKALIEALNSDNATTATPNWLIRQALARYTRSPAYLESIIAGHERIDLTGQSVEPVTEAAIARAQTQRAEQKTRSAERRRQHAQTAADQRRAEKLQRLADRFNQ